MGFFDFLTGGSKSKTTTTDITPPEFAGLRPETAEFISQFLATGGPGLQGPAAAGLGGQEQALINQAVAGAQGGGPGGAAINPAIQQLIQTLQGRFLPGQEGANPFLDAVIAATQGDITRQFEDVIVPQLLSRFTGAGQEVQGQGSSAFAREARLAGTENERLLADTAAKIRSGAFESERGRQTEAITQAGQVIPALTEESLSRLTTGLQAAALPRLIQEKGIEAGTAEFTRRINSLIEVLRLAGQLGQPTTAAQSTAKQTGGLF